MSAHGPMPRSAWIFPALAVLFFAGATALGFTFTPSAAGLVFAAVLLVILFGTVFAAVHHAEVIAERIGEPYGTLLLTLSVTMIEVALIATIMLGDKPVPTLARDTVFAVVMIVCNGLVGICILAGGLRYREQDVQVTGLEPLSQRPDRAGDDHADHAQLYADHAGADLLGRPARLRQRRHRCFSMACSSIPRPSGIAIISSARTTSLAEGGIPLSNRMLGLSIGLLLISLLAVVLLAKKFSLVVDFGTALIGAPPAFAGVLVALLILLPESVAAVAAARKNDLQKSINLALGSSLATIGLTIPAVAVAAYALDKQLVLGLDAQSMVLLVLTFVLSMLTFGTGRTNILFGLVHVVVFAVFVFMVFVP